MSFTTIGAARSVDDRRGYAAAAPSHLVRVAAAGLLAAGSALAISPSAEAVQKCAGSTYAGRCITTSNITYRSSVVETVPLTNSSRYKVTMNCSFTQTISRSFGTTTSLTASLKASVWGVAEASVSGTQSMTLSQRHRRPSQQVGRSRCPRAAR